MATKKNVQADRIIARQSETVGIDTVKPYGKNPRKGDVAMIAESLQENGQFRPIVVNGLTMEILAGNHTWRAAKSLGWSDIQVAFVEVDEERAKKIVLSDNRTSDIAGYDTQILSEILGGLVSPVGTGYSDDDVADLLQGIQEANIQSVEAVLSPSRTMPVLGDDTEDAIGGGGAMGAYSWADEDDDLTPAGSDDEETLDNALGQLQGVLQLSEDMQFAGNNYYGIPDLVKSGLLQKLPDPIDTWGGHEATPDDGKSWWVWNYGVASRKNLPMDRAILSFFTYDTYFEVFWDNPAFMVAKMLNAGITTAIVPDYSYYSDIPCAQWVFNAYRAQWLGRYFQEAGIKVIPRIQFAIDKLDSASLDFNCFGIPKNAPVVAKCSHNSNSQKEFDLDVYGLQKSLEKIEPQQLLIYGGKPALRVIDALDPVKKGLCGEVVHVYNYAHKRRGVVYDKKEGLAAKKRDKARISRDRSSEIEDEETE